MKHSYHQFTVRDFVLDDAFRRWVFQPNEPGETFWQTFLLTHPEQQATIDEATAILLNLGVRYDDLTDASQQRIRQVLERAASARRFDDHPQRYRNPVPTFIQPLSVWKKRRFTWQAAASLTGLLLIAGVSVWYALTPKQQRIHTAFGENRSVILPDGSTVLLNGNSTISFTNDWADKQRREVWLDGEGFFKVTRKQTGANQVKFVTHTAGLDITVLGTQFNVNSRRGNTAVMLVEGRVLLSRPGWVQPGEAGPGASQSRVVEMKPGQYASAQPSIETVEVRNEKPQIHTAWTQRELVFENTALRDIAQQLRDTHGLEIVFEDNDLASRRFTGNLTNESTETLLTTLSLTFDLTVRHDGDRVVLQRNP